VTEPAQLLPEAPANSLGPDDLHIRPGANGVTVDPERAGWRYLAFSVRRAEPGATVTIHPGTDREAVAVLVSGPDLEVRDIGTMAGRTSPFDGLPSALYVPAGCRVDLEPPGPVDLALAVAPTSGRVGVTTEPRLITPSQVDVEIRGTGRATRQINHIVKPDFPADRLLLVEVLTPGGNWSSWPPHKHDIDNMPKEAVLEEIYHYRFRRSDAFGVQRLYRRPGTPLASSSGPRDTTWAVRDGDVVLVTDGYHPFVAAPADDAYYLNALAGDRRTMACSFDPAFDAEREAWASMAPDPRLPLVPPPG
jgi:5-deoxy-glucuronate isomerase